MSYGKQPHKGDLSQRPPQAITAAMNLDDITLYLEVFVNQVRYPSLVPITLRKQELFAKARELKKLGIAMQTASDNDNIALSSLSGIEVNYRVNTQQLILTAPLSLMSLPMTKLWASDSLQPPQAVSSPGSLLNYDLYANHTGDHQFVSAAAEVRAFGFGKGVFSHTSSSHTQRSGNGDWSSDSVALDTFAEWSFPGNATRLTIGDSVSGGLNWSRSLRLSGIQYGRNFRLQPYRTVSPLASFIGKATLPSTVELYIDGVRRYQSNVPPGPFEINAVPSITGVGQAQVITTDSLGRSTTINIPFYNTQQLLEKGLSDWTLAAGFVREDYGIKSFSYGNKLSGKGNFRYGINNQLTIESQAELDDRLINTGIGAVWQPGLVGVVSLAYSRSHDQGASGYQTAWRYSWNNSRFNFSVASQRTFGQYRDLASHYSTLPAKRSEQLLASAQTKQMGNIGVNAIRFDNADLDEPAARYAGIYWNNRISNGVSVNLSYNQNLDDSNDRTFQFGFSIVFGQDLQLHSSIQRNNDRNLYQASLQRTLPSDGGFGWRLQSSENGATSNTLARGSWQGNYGRIDSGIAHANSDQSGFVQASGSLVWMNQQGFASRRINDSFAVVSTSGIANIPVKLENRVIGYTNKNGNLLVTRLNTWQHNNLSIDPMDLPADNKVTDIYQSATPSDRAGTLVEFTVEKVRAAIVVLTDQTDIPLPVASRVLTEQSNNTPIFVGFDGQTYIENLQDYNYLRVITPEGTCHVEFSIPPGQIPNHYLGPYQCKKAKY
ncbi:fimbria/pilus outer membrane usher protein [Gilvimarinus sp. 2_MG-2023]|uniref:fimbria/pilus outer membrane usher protein n=1 Tax=Gilvimarinus sp. 2_MG-2023 TaxID=3062666 RepID=UPI0026E13E59|nr:fimbria/pilus outer membrane usher protein [Gilvimarinus sp. 2_MG-2023]MDO6571160.1 fimbria/pilus outer membrane usher protein [Gilvimarinus sp. 2_MG-2023]